MAIDIIKPERCGTVFLLQGFYPQKIIKDTKIHVQGDFIAIFPYISESVLTT